MNRLCMVAVFLTIQVCAVVGLAKPARCSEAAAEAVGGHSGAAPAPGQRLQVFVGFYVNAIRDVNWAQRQFYADVYWWIRYPVQESNRDQETIENIEFVNTDPTNFSHKELERKVIATSHGTEMYVSYRTVAFFHFDADFHRYPFDTQTLPIILEHETRGSDELILVDDVESYGASSVEPGRWGLGDDVSLPEFTATGTSRRVSNHPYKTHFGDLSLVASGSAAFFDCSRMTLAIKIRRNCMPYLIKIMIPLIICLLLPYLVFFIAACNLEVASGLTVTSLLACVAIQLTVVPGLPNVGYIVTSDKLFYLAYLLSMLAMAQTVWTYSLAKQGNDHLAQKLDNIGRIAYPAIFIAGFAWIVAS